MIIDALNIIGDELVIEFKNFANEHISSGSLSRSIKYKVVGKTLYVTMNKYAAYLDQGTKPHPVPPKALEKWARKKGLNEYAVSANIKKYGTKAYPFLDEFDDVVKKNIKKISNETAKEITGFIVREFNKMQSIK